MMPFEINWTVVALSFAVASALFYLYLYVLALIRKRKAEQQVRAAQARLQKFINVLKEGKR